MQRTIWLDCDPGLDDWLTLLLLARSEQFHLAGISITAGNAPLTTTLDNARSIRALHGLQVPIHAGFQQDAPTITAQNVLGVQGMRTTGATLSSAAPATAQPLDTADAVSALLAYLKTNLSAQSKPTTLVAIGPLTNIARAIEQDPKVMQTVKAIVIMGGSTERGNHTPAAEFNIYADPEAASIVFQSGIPIRMFGLNLCRQLLLKQDHVQTVQSWFEAPQSPAKPAAGRVLAGYLDAYQRIRSADGSIPMPLYDPAVALWLLAPEFFEFQAVPVDIELIGQFTRGMTVCDLRNRDQRPCNAQIAMRVDGDAAMALFMDQLKLALIHQPTEKNR